jgi:quinone-modifying oxidoreductase subunit QmoC
MMSLRRWLTACYDWTGISGLFYKSLWLNIIAFILVAIGVLSYGAGMQYHLPAIMHGGHHFEILAIAGVFAVILLPNIVRMWWYSIVRPGHNIPAKTYLTNAGELFLHMFTQKRSLNCDSNRFRWFEHLILVAGYLVLLFTTVFLNWFSTTKMWVIVMGYSVSFIVFAVTFHFVADRIRKIKELSRFSRPSDWLFVIWLFMMGLSAFFVRLFIDLQILEQNRWLYLVHLVILAQWALLIVPFGKWTHFLYRSFAMYFEKIKTTGSGE